MGIHHKTVVLFDGTSLDGWINASGEPANWTLEDGVMTVTPSDPASKEKNDIISTEVYKDAVLHVEFRTPHMPEATGQLRGNSGVYIQGRYEIQILDSYGVDIPRANDCGAVYEMHAPLVNACKPPLEWQTFDMYFRAPRAEASGEITEHARVTMLLNDVLIHSNVVIPRPTGNVMRKGIDPDVTKPGPILLQCHGRAGDRVSYRNIWIQHLPAEGPGQDTSD